MSCESEEIQIGDSIYIVTQWPADKSLLMKFKLGKIFQSSVAELGKGVGLFTKDLKDIPVDKAAELFQNTLAKLFENNSPEEIRDFIRECIVGGTACDGKIITNSSFNSIFSGDKLMDIYKVFIFVLQVNYRNLLKGQLGSKINNLVGLMKSPKNTTQADSQI